MILNLGDGGRSLWFTGNIGSGGGTYTDPPGEFSTLTKNSGSGGGYTDTLTDGTQITFNSSGYETATIDFNGLHTTLLLQRLEPAHVDRGSLRERTRPLPTAAATCRPSRTPPAG